MKDVIFFDYDSIFSTRLRELIKEKNITKQKLSEEIGVSRQAISQYCEGSTIPNTDKLLKIAEYFNVSTDYLLGSTDVKNTELKIKEICDYTGLSEKAVEILHYHSHFKCFGEKILTSEEFLNYLNFILSDDKYSIILGGKLRNARTALNLALENRKLENRKTSFLREKKVILFNGEREFKMWKYEMLELFQTIFDKYFEEETSVINEDIADYKRLIDEILKNTDLN